MVAPLDGGSSDLVANLGSGTVRDVDLVAGNARVRGGAGSLTLTHS